MDFFKILPFELISKIINKLNNYTEITNCSLVCKKWYEVLTVTKIYYPVYLRKNYSKNKLKNLTNIIFLSNLDKNKRDVTIKLFKSLVFLDIQKINITVYNFVTLINNNPYLKHIKYNIEKVNVKDDI